ncbi:MAG: GlcG/HbpS family heme-binding protein [Anaeromyxobacteraceae bacterium]
MRKAIGLGVATCAALAVAWFAAAQELSGLPTVPVLTLALAQRAAAGSNAACQAQGHAVTSTVVDASGNVIAQLRSDGATAATVDVSREKAFAAAGFKSPTSQLRDAARNNPGFIAIPRFSILAGGLPITSGSTVVGAIGVSGAPADDIDATCAQAGLASIGAGGGAADGGAADGGADGGGAPDGGGSDGGSDGGR